MRLPYVANPPPASTRQDAEIIERIQQRRAPRALQPLDLALLHSPPLADGWNSFLGAVRTKTNLAADLRELAISRVAVCNSAWYEWKHHAPLAVEAGVSNEALETVKQEGELAEVEKPAALNDRQWAVLLYTDEMTRNVQVRDETFARLESLFDDREVVEITGTVSSPQHDQRAFLLLTNFFFLLLIFVKVAAYNCVSRFLVALDGKAPGLTTHVMLPTGFFSDTF